MLQINKPLIATPLKVKNTYNKEIIVKTKATNKKL